MQSNVCKMTHTPTKKPFSGKIFYLDLKNFRNQEELMKDLKKLGGKVESFLSKEVTHVLTDRKEYSKRESLGSDGTNLNNLPRSWNKMHHSPMDYFNSPTYSPRNDYGHSRSPIISRGLTLVQKAQQMREGTTDVIEVCNQWKIKIVHIEVVVSWIYRFKVEYTKSIRKQLEKHLGDKHPLDTSRSELRRLSEPFIKVEDMSLQYKPFFKEFKTFERFVDPELHAAFSAVMQDVSSHSTPKEVVASKFGTEILKESNVNLKQRNSIHFKIHPLKPSDKPLFTLKTCTNQPMIECGNEGMKENMPLCPKDEKRKRKASGATIIRIPKDETIKKVKKKHCEICQCSYIDLDNHLRTATHQKYLNNPDNFKELKEIIQAFPHTSDFLSKWTNHDKEAPASRYSSSLERPSLVKNFKNSEGGKISILQTVPVLKWHTTGNYFEDVKNTGQYITTNQEFDNALLHLPALDKNYSNCEKANHISVYCEEKSVFNTSVCMNDANYANENEFSDHAIDLCTRNVKPMIKADFGNSSTETYELDAVDFISASCSSESLSCRTLPFLEDSIGNI